MIAFVTYHTLTEHFKSQLLSWFHGVTHSEGPCLSCILCCRHLGIINNSICALCFVRELCWDSGACIWIDDSYPAFSLCHEDRILGVLTEGRKVQVRSLGLPFFPSLTKQLLPCKSQLASGTSCSSGWPATCNIERVGFELNPTSTS